VFGFWFLSLDFARDYPEPVEGLVFSKGGPRPTVGLRMATGRGMRVSEEGWKDPTCAARSDAACGARQEITAIAGGAAFIFFYRRCVIKLT